MKAQDDEAIPDLCADEGEEEEGTNYLAPEDEDGDPLLTGEHDNVCFVPNLKDEDEDGNALEQVKTEDCCILSRTAPAKVSTNFDQTNDPKD